MPDEQTIIPVAPTEAELIAAGPHTKQILTNKE